MSLRSEGLIVYAKLSKGSRPVVDAKVVAKITPVSDQTETQLCVELKDNGAGDPDITKDDGIYSRYVEGIKNIGRHTLVVEAKSDGNAALLRSATVPGERIAELRLVLSDNIIRQSGPLIVASNLEYLSIR